MSNLLASEFLQRNTNAFNESRVALRYPQLTLNAGLPISERRDYTGNSANGGTATKVNGEYRVRATSTSGSIGSLISRQRANYISGGEVEGGIGLRIPDRPTGDAHIDWGFIDYDGNNAIMLYEDSSGVNVKLVSGGVDVIDKPQNEWNIDTLDGTGASEYNLDVSDGHVTHIPFIYYGFGDIIIEIMVLDDDRQRMIPAHRIKRDGSISIDVPNLPLAVEVYSGTSGAQLDAYVGGRQINSSMPDDIPPRFTSGRRLSQTVSSTFVPLVSFKHKSSFKEIFSVFEGVEIITDQDLVIEVHRNGTLTGSDFAYVGNQDTAEMALQYDIAATAITGGEMIYDTFAVNTGNNKGLLRDIDVPPKYLSEFDTYSVVAKIIGATDATVHTIARNSEKW